MSRGPGRIERVIADIFTANPSMTYAVDDLAAFAYPGLNRVEKKHRVAVVRAADNVMRRLRWTCQQMELPGHPLLYFNPLDHRSYVVGRMRVSWNSWNFSHAEIADASDNPNIDRAGAEHWRREAEPGSAFWTHVEINCAEHAGDHQRASALRAELNASLNRRALMLGLPPVRRDK